MGVLVDIVPNHVGVATPAQSAWWWELLREGPGSLAAQRFDVDWAANDGRILVPIIGDDDLRDDGTIAHLTIEGGLLCYHDHRFPIAPGTDGGSPDEVHAAQHYELAGWRRADDELNYRRFFTINTLAAIRVEDPDVFAESHAEIRRWFARGAGRRPARRPPGRRTRPRGLPDRPLRPDRRVLRARREDPGAGRGPGPGLVLRGHHRLRRPGLHRPGAHRPCWRGTARRARGPAAWRRGRLAPADPRHQAGRGRRGAARRGAADRARPSDPRRWFRDAR